jgi:hypothetical protein
MTALSTIAPAFVDIAHRIVWCTVATVDTAGRPRTRVLHPLWEWDGSDLTGWIVTDPTGLKARHLARTPTVALSYWDAVHDVASAVCDVRWRLAEEDRVAGWARFADAPPPVGYDPAVIPGWESPSSPTFGILELRARRLDVMPGTVLTQGAGHPISWSR